jgi:2,4-dienoyl-CoA reductase-like NADH-dependent reductase (Old Yellow Enzyme family)/thioredoxin reductase
MQTRYEHLFSPFNIGKVQLKNRIVKTAAQTYLFESGENRVGTLAKGFYGAVARGGAGLVITETPAMEWPLLEEGDRRHRIDNDKYIKNLSELSAEVHKYGCPIFTQLYHRGPWSGIYALIAEPCAASAVTYPSPFDVHDEKPPHVLTIDEIEELVDRFASGTARLQQAGWDGIEINAAADHLFHSFLSRFWNKRDDKYGPQSMENRTRFIVDVVKEIKKRCGQDFPVQVLMNAIEVGLPGDEALSLDEGKEIARIYQSIGVDSLHVRSHWAGMHQGSYNQENMFYPEPHIPLKEFPRELDWTHHGALAQVPLAAEIKKVVSIPVMTVGLIDADSGEAILREGKADLIGINRRFFADNNWANKVREGRLEDIQPCTHCGTCNKNYNEPRYCRINACFGTDSYDMAPPATKKKKVVVVGAGPSGMQAARVAAARGHDVTLYEQGGYLGGAVALASMVKGFEIEELPKFLKFFRTQVKKTGVKVKLHRQFDDSVLTVEKPDVLVVAAGGVPTKPDVPGYELKNVVKTADLYALLKVMIRFFGPQLLRKLTKFWMPVGKKVVVVGGAIQGCQLSEFLIKRGRNVTIVEEGEELGEWLVPERKTRLFYWFDKKGIERLTGVKLVKFTKEGVTIETKEGKTRLLEANTIIPVLPFSPNKELAEKLTGKVAEVYTIGDCDSPAVIPDATKAGWRVGNTI